MRDGVVLRADVYRPDSATPVPAIVNRTPYDRTFALIPPAALDPQIAVDSGFALVVQDVRGLHASDGEFYPFVHDGRDTYDSVEWAAAQPWCTGDVGMSGRSYAAASQWLGAIAQPPHLKAIFPVLTGSDYYNGWIYQGGAFQLGFNLFWIKLMSDARGASRVVDLYRHLPLTTVPIDDPAWARIYGDWLSHSTDDEYWQTLSFNRRYESVRAPAFIVGGWYDVFLGGTIENFVGLRDGAGTPGAREGTRLLLGPWSHGSTYGAFPDHAFDVFGPSTGVDLADLQVRFFARHLRGDPVVDDEPPVTLFVMGENRWRAEDDWPLARAVATRLFLREGGRLSREGPGDEAPDEYVYEPNDPAPTIGGPTSLPARMLKMNSGPLDQRGLEGRDDVLLYTSEALDAPLTVIGPLAVVLHAATSATDTDFVAKLIDVAPDGSSIILAEGVLRTRFREGFAREVLVEPWQPYELRIDLAATANVFLPGHRVRLAVTSSSFPRFDRNPNTGHPLGVDGAGDLCAARQMIFHDPVRPSRLLLHVEA